MKKLPGLSPTSYAMLGLLARKPQSAYELNSLMQHSLIRVYWPRAESHVYSEPRKLLAHRLVTEQKQQLSGRKRTVYTITDQGRDRLQQWLRADADTDLRMQAEFMLKLILADAGSAEDARTTLEQSYRASRQDIEEAIEGIQRIFAHPGSAAEGMPYNGVVINLMADMLITRYRWGSFALQVTADITDESSADDKQAAGLAAYTEALDKLQAALAGS